MANHWFWGKTKTTDKIHLLILACFHVQWHNYTKTGTSKTRLDIYIKSELHLKLSEAKKAGKGKYAKQVEEALRYYFEFQDALDEAKKNQLLLGKYKDNHGNE